MTSQIKPVLVATDLSPRSDRAVDRATFLAKRWNVPLIVLHAIEPDSKIAGNPVDDEEIIRGILPDPNADVIIVPAIGSAPTVIVEAAKSANCSLIVTGVARFNHIRDYFIGTAVDYVVRHSTVPVLVVKQRPHLPYTSILVAIDCSSCARQALLTAANLFPDAAIHVVHAYHVPYEGWLRSDGVKQECAEWAQADLDNFMQDVTIPQDLRDRLTTHLGYGETPSVLWKTAADVNADLVVLGTHGRSGFSQAVIGSTADALLQSMSCDTLMVREIS
ncbi:MAG: universal stress protein [Sphingorhabdus sp.]|uniref:universal stress protein n=1 Tax=Sphingorhabdus sp. TaxID=1902408 RepID=UPI0025F177E7|nr:universal stress protein [Sphingorhabdus sp.]MCO4092919.1 universal stress protein [Sphingorhabdus sp.]